MNPYRICDLQTILEISNHESTTRGPRNDVADVSISTSNAERRAEAAAQWTPAWPLHTNTTCTRRVLTTIIRKMSLQSSTLAARRVKSMSEWLDALGRRRLSGFPDSLSACACTGSSEPVASHRECGTHRAAHTNGEAWGGKVAPLPCPISLDAASCRWGANLICRDFSWKTRRQNS